MKRFNGIAGDCFLLKESRSPVEHLYTLATNPLQSSGEVVVVNITSNDADSTVFIRRGEHSFIIKDSFVAYQFAKTAQIQPLMRAIEARAIQDVEPFREDILLRIQEGFLESIQTPNRIKTIMQQYLRR
jgi:hypothetical protein